MIAVAHGAHHRGCVLVRVRSKPVEHAELVLLRTVLADGGFGFNAVDNDLRPAVWKVAACELRRASVVRWLVLCASSPDREASARGRLHGEVEG